MQTSNEKIRIFKVKELENPSKSMLKIAYEEGMYLLVYVVHDLHNKSISTLCVKENGVHQVMPILISSM